MKDAFPLKTFVWAVSESREPCVGILSPFSHATRHHVGAVLIERRWIVIIVIIEYSSRACVIFP